MAFVIPAIAALGTALGSTAAAGSAAAAAAGAADIGLAASVAGGLVGAAGAYASSKAEAGAAKYNSNVAKQNAAIATQNSQIASQAGAAQAGISEQKTRATVGAIQANQAASGIDVNSGSAVDVRSSASELGELDALTVRSNATREAYGYQVQAESDTQQSNLDKYEEESAHTSGVIGEASTFLGGAGSAASNFAKYQMNGGFGY